jgi:hypothetical protein
MLINDIIITSQTYHLKVQTLVIKKNNVISMDDSFTLSDTVMLLYVKLNFLNFHYYQIY